jgi:AAA family ATP:ADP antiporter
MSEPPAGWTRIERLFSLITRLRPGEGQALQLFFLHAFLLLASLQIVKALREAFMLSKFSAETRSYAVGLMALALMLIVPLYGYMRRRLDGAKLLRAVTMFFVATLPLLALLAHYGVSIAFVFYMWVGIYGVMVVSQLWAYAADSFNVKTGQRLFVVIMLGANLGALVGAKFTNLAVEALSPLGLMVLATCTIGATLLLAGPERAAVPEGSRAIPELRHAAPVPRLLGGIGLVLRDRYLLTIALFIVMLNWINSTGEFILADYVKAHAVQTVGDDPDAVGQYVAAFYGDFHFWVTLVSLAIQALLVARIYRTLGLRGALLVHPTIVAIGYGLLALAPLIGGFIPLFSLIRRIKVADNGVDYSLMNTTRQTLFLPVDRDSKYDGKTAIDTFFVRFGDLLQALSVFVGLHLLAWGAHEFAILTFVLSLAWLWLAVVMGRAYTRRAVASMPNTAPKAIGAIPDLHCEPGQPFTHVIPTGAFHDADPGDVLVYRARCEDGGPLPRWLKFDTWRHAFVGTLPAHVELIELRVIVVASDLDGHSARTTFVVRRVATDLTAAAITAPLPEPQAAR